MPPAALPTGARPEALLVAPPPAVAGEGVAKRVVTDEAPGRIPAQQTATTAMADKVRADKMADARAGAAAEKGQVVGGVAGGVVGGVAGGFVPKAALAESIAPAPGEARPVRAVSPDGATEWQFETGGGIRRSTDGGRTWFPQPSGAAGGVLLAASAPASNVCWAVGRKGLVIMTADGNRWLARQSPDATDLVAVAARDASNAVVTTADGRRFETTDGGTTWSLIR
ncbi:MAG: hypothetical protein EHM24_09545 [Acidobacteria bacterium]|nr:MAG: hypothetical protein EHM24_09545 [Acidobacteriota bacterium]